VLAVVDEIDAEPFQRGRSVPAQKIADVAFVAAHRQRVEVRAGQRSAEGAEPRVVPPATGTPSVLYAISTPRIEVDSLRTICCSSDRYCVQSVLYAMIVRRVRASAQLLPRNLR
jgi:hypothetical protein